MSINVELAKSCPRLRPLVSNYNDALLHDEDWQLFKGLPPAVQMDIFESWLKEYKLDEDSLEKKRLAQEIEQLKVQSMQKLVKKSARDRLKEKLLHKRGIATKDEKDMKLSDMTNILKEMGYNCNSETLFEAKVKDTSDNIPDIE